MSEAKYGEPWTVFNQDHVGVHLPYTDEGQRLMGKMIEVVQSRFGGNYVYIFENYHRAAICINACAGMEDPAAEIAALREENEKLRAALVNVVCEFREVKAYARNKNRALELADEIMEQTK